MRNKKESLKVICDKFICEARGSIPRCYLDYGPGTYKNCMRYMLWKDAEEMEKNKNRRTSP